MSKARGFFLVVVMAMISVIVGEVGLRLGDNYSVLSLTLVSARPAASVALDHARRYVRAIATADGVDRSWFEQDPALATGETAPDKALSQRYWAHPGSELPSIYEWNRQYVLSVLCAGQPFLNGVNDVVTFEPISGSLVPRSRLPQNKFLPSGLITNAFGWRGPQIGLNRPPGTVRIAFVGASTTINAHGAPFSYPEYIGQWLKVWAQAKSLPIKFEIINAGREGTNSEDFVAIVQDELLAVDPDLVIYSEGSNQFWPTDFIEWPGGAVPAKPYLIVRQPGWLETHSAIAQSVAKRLPGIAYGAEPEKPFGKVNWPAAVDEFDPDLASEALPVNLPTILADLQSIKRSLESIHATLVPSSFVWLAYQGMQLDPVRQHSIYADLNEVFWPFPYAHIRRMADFQNRAFKKFAATNHLPFLDIARDYPQDPELFGDAVHMTQAGTKLHAWIAFQQLVPILKDKLAKGDLPRPIRPHPLIHHPAFAKPAALQTMTELKRECASPQSRDKQRVSDLSEIQKVLERYHKDVGRYPVLPKGFVSWGQCSGGVRANWIPNGSNYSWSARYIAKMPGDPNIACYFPFNPSPEGKAQYMYYSDNGQRYAIVAALEDPSNSDTLKSRGTAWLPVWFNEAVGSTQGWWGGTYIVLGGE